MTQHEIPVDHYVDGPAGRLHVTELGDGPLVLLMHGFPETAATWRHQMHALAAAGFRAAAIDVRGYGRSAKPANPHAYRLLDHVADNVAVVRALGARTARVIGHDWGSPIASTSALLRPDVFTAVGLLGVPYAPRGPIPPSAVFQTMAGDEEFYVSYLQKPGRAEAEIEKDLRGWLGGFYATLTADTVEPLETAPWFLVPRDGRMRDRFVDRNRAGWLSETELDALVTEFERTGFAGALNRYRCMDEDWRDLAAFDGAVIGQPSIFLIGEQDASRSWLAEAIDAQAQALPGLVSQHVVAGAGHWLHREAASTTSDLLVDWLKQLPGDS